MGNESITLIFIISAIRSVGTGIQTPAVGAILPQIVPMEKMTRVNGINSALTSAMMLLSPAVAGIFFATLGFGYTLLLDVVTAALAVTIMSFLKVRTYQREIKDGDESLKEGTFSELKAGLSYTRNNKLISRILIFYAVFFFMVSPAASVSYTHLTLPTNREV